MKEKTPFGAKLSNVSQWLVALFSLIAFGFLSLVSLIQTCHVDINYTKDNNEHVSFLNDNVLINLVILAVLILLALLLMRAKVSRKTVFWVAFGAFCINAAVGVWWVLSARAMPTADSLQIISTAQRLIQGDTGALAASEYFKIYPYQTGYLLFAEGFLRLFGTNSITLFQLFNPLFVCLSTVAVVLIAKELFDDPKIELLTALLAGLCFQPALLSTFLYGTLPGMALAMWSIYCVVRAIRRGKLAPLIPAMLLITLAILLKKNFWIVLIAESIMLFLFVIRSKKTILLIGLACMCALSAMLPSAVQRYYESRGGVSFGKGTPQMAWLVTGFNDSSLAPGWYNSYTGSVLRRSDFDYNKALALCKADFVERVELFASRPIYLASFFYYKITSQWNEPEFQSIWSSASARLKGQTSPVSEFVLSLGTGRASEVIHEYFNQVMQFVYVAMAFSFWILLRKKEERDEARMIIPLILIGAALYHALFEAKSQYAIIYIHMMLPYAAFGIKKLSERFALMRGGN
ncbi:MAG: glycosyltransferase family 39 protein [Christensenella sp.]|nr:glycosyltransferase family 39 protein [Christensenella sp.]